MSAVVDVLGFAGNGGPKGTLGDAAETGLARSYLGGGNERQQATTGAAQENLDAQRAYNLAKAEYDAWKAKHISFRNRNPNAYGDSTG